MPAPTVHPGDIALTNGIACDLIDVRTRPEFDQVHAQGAQCHPLDALDPARIWNQRQHPSAPLLLICRSGMRAQKAAERFIAAGFGGVAVVDGGTDAWIAAGLPVIRGRSTMSLERQVRIVAGSLIVLGCVLGWFANPLWYGLAALIGAGLVIAGITGTCALGMALTWLPWNRRASLHRRRTLAPSSSPGRGGAMTRRVLIVGGVAGGASCAARLRRLDETAEIMLYDRGPYVSFANCGLPYYVGNVISDESKLMMASAELFQSRFAIAVRTRHEVTGIDAQRHTITVRDLAAGTEGTQGYDALVLAPGAQAIRPALPGIDLPGIFTLRTIPDSRNIRSRIATHQARSALVIGAGFIGLEVAENLAHLGLAVTMVEKADQVLPPLDRDVAELVRERLRAHQVQVHTEEAVAAFAADGGALAVTTDRGRSLSADIIILAIGIRPETALARGAGLAIGERGGIRVDQHMRTSDASIWAVGDAVETVDFVTGKSLVLPLAGPANRQGRIAAESIAGRESSFRGVQGTSVCGAFGLTIAMTGASEKALRRAGITDFSCVYLHPGHHASYYPGAKPMHLKVIFRPEDGRILGAQGVGEEGVDKRIDVIAMALQLGGTVHDLSEAELCYAPQFGSAKDPVNLAGFIGENVRLGDAPLAEWAHIGAPGFPTLDVRDPVETATGVIPGAILIPLPVLRERMREIPAAGPIHVVCAAGQRAYYAVRFLRLHGIDARLVAGGMMTWKLRQGMLPAPAISPPAPGVRA